MFCLGGETRLKRRLLVECASCAGLLWTILINQRKLVLDMHKSCTVNYISKLAVNVFTRAGTLSSPILYTQTWFCS